MANAGITSQLKYAQVADSRQCEVGEEEEEDDKRRVVD